MTGWTYIPCALRCEACGEKLIVVDDEWDLCWTCDPREPLEWLDWHREAEKGLDWSKVDKEEA